MRIAISNIAWDTSEDEAVASLLRECAVDAVDIAPTKYFPDPASTDSAHVLLVRDWWRERGIEITGMQALLFGTAGLNLFGDEHVQARMLEHLGSICRIGTLLGATRLVFGSPKNRDRNGLADADAHKIAMPFFTRLAEIADRHEVTLCLEPNPARYGCNFMTNSAATASIVSELDHPRIRMQLDLGAMSINHERAEDVLREHASLVGHVHVSEPDLAPVGTGNTDHEQIGSLLQSALPGHVACIEMLAAKGEAHIPAIERALRIAKRCYGTAPKEDVR